MTSFLLIAAAGASVLLSGCGGGGSPSVGDVKAALANSECAGQITANVGPASSEVKASAPGVTTYGLVSCANDGVTYFVFDSAMDAQNAAQTGGGPGLINDNVLVTPDLGDPSLNSSYLDALAHQCSCGKIMQ